MRERTAEGKETGFGKGGLKGQMGKQINYWMDYDSFLLLAQKALDLGCRIVKEDLDAGTGACLDMVNNEGYALC